MNNQRTNRSHSIFTRFKNAFLSVSLLFATLSTPTFAQLPFPLSDISSDFVQAYRHQTYDQAYIGFPEIKIFDKSYYLATLKDADALTNLWLHRYCDQNFPGTELTIVDHGYIPNASDTNRVLYFGNHERVYMGHNSPDTRLITTLVCTTPGGPSSRKNTLKITKDLTPESYFSIKALRSSMISLYRQKADLVYRKCMQKNRKSSAVFSKERKNGRRICKEIHDALKAGKNEISVALRETKDSMVTLSIAETYVAGFPFFEDE